MVKVQEKRVGDGYTQFWIPLPKKICTALGIEKGTEFEVMVDGRDLILRRKEG